MAIAACSPAGPAIPNGTSVACNPPGTQTGRIGNGPNGGGDNVIVNVNDGATIDVQNTNAISLHNNATIMVGSVSGTATATVETDTNGNDGGQYGKGDNTIEFNNNSTVTIFKNGQVIASGTEQTSEAINPIGSGNTIVNNGLIKAGASSAIFFENVDTSGGRNVVDNFGIIDARGGSNPTTGGEAIGSFGAVGITITNETGATIFGNLDLQQGNDIVTLKTGSVITGNLNGGGGGGTDVLNLSAAAGASDSLPGTVVNFEILNKTGPGTWTLTGAVGANGGRTPLAVTVADGTLVLTGDNAGFNGSVVIDPGATLEARAQSLPPNINDLSGDLLINQVSPDGVQPNDGTYTGHIIGTGAVTKIGNGTLTLTGANTYSGGTVFDVGAIAASADSAFGATSGPLTFNGGELKLDSDFDLAATRLITLNAPSAGLAGGGTIDANGFQTTIAQGIMGLGGLTIADSSVGGAGRVILTGSNSYSGGTTIAAGTLQLGNGGATGSIVGDVVDNGTLAFDRSDDAFFFGQISGSGSVSQIGSGSTTLTASNSYSGGTLLAGGTLIAGADSALGTGALTVAANPAGTTLDNNAEATILANAIVLNPSANLTVAGSNPLTLAGAISGDGALTKNGASTLILTADNSYAGGTTINTGTLQVGNGGATGSLGSGPVLDDAALVFNRSGIVTVPGVISGMGSLTQMGVDGGTLILTGADTFSGGTTVVSGTLQLGDGGSTGSIVGNVGDSGTLAFDRSDMMTFAGVISGSGGVAQIGSGTTLLTANSPYTGGTTISQGTLAVGDFAHTTAALSGGGPIAVGAGGTLGGYGSVIGPTVNNGVIAPGSATPGFADSPTGTFTIVGNLLNQGVIQFASEASIGNVLEVRGNYLGSGTMNINTFLGGDGSPSDRLVIDGGAATGNTSVHVANVGGPGALTTGNGILVVDAIGGATTSPAAFTLSNGELRGGAFDYRLFRGGVSGGANDWFLRSDFIVPPIPPEPPIPPIPPEPPLPPDPPPHPLPPGTYPIIGPELATYGVVQPLARQLGAAILGTLDDRVGDTYAPDGCGVTAANAPEGVPTKKSSPAPCPIFWPSVWGRFFGETVNNHYQAFADPHASGNLGGFQGGVDLLRGSVIAGHSERAGLYGAYGDVSADVNGLVTNPAATAYIFTHAGSLNLNAWSLGGYWTHVGPGGWYLNATLQGTWYGGSASTQFARLDANGTGFIASLEGGVPLALPQLGPGFVLEPQGQILWQKVSFAHADDGVGDVELGDTTGPSGRIGLRGKWTIAVGEQVWQPYLRANLWQDWGAEVNTTYSGADVVPLQARGTQLQLGAGLTARINANVSLYANADYQFAIGNTQNNWRSSVQGVLGAKYAW
jgi:outer membrane autotransporter protein